VNISNNNPTSEIHLSTTAFLVMIVSSVAGCCLFAFCFGVVVGLLCGLKCGHHKRVTIAQDVPASQPSSNTPNYEEIESKGNVEITPNLAYDFLKKCYIKTNLSVILNHNAVTIIFTFFCSGLCYQCHVDHVNTRLLLWTNNICLMHSFFHSLEQEYFAIL